MNLRPLLFLIGSLLLPLACGEPAGPDYATLAITTRWLKNAVLNVPYSDTLAAAGGDSVYSWSLTVGSLPTGLSLNTSTGVVSGTSSVVGSDTFTVQVASGDGQTDTQQLTITLATTAILQPDELCSDYPDSPIVTFEDTNLEAAIRAALSVGAQEDLTCGLVSALTELDAEALGITSVMGVQNLTGVTILRLWGNSITDIGPLSGLTSLSNLWLGYNSISDSGPLSGLTGLERLYVDFNSISDIGALGGLTSLSHLTLSANSISDISALSGLTNLTWLNLSGNANLTDIQPLLDNAGLGAGDTVYLESANVSCTDVATLEAKGVTVQSDCP